MKRMHRSSLRTLVVTAALVLAMSLAGCGLGSSGDTMENLVEPDRAVQDGGGTAYAPEFEEAEMAAEEKGAAISSEGSFGVDAATVPAQERMIQRTAALRIDVADVEDAVARIREETSKLEGIVTDVQVSTDEDIPIYRYDAIGSLADGAALSGYITVRVPSASYDDFVKAVSGIGDVVRQSENESDVTQEYIDLEARLKNLEAQEARLREFSAQAKNVEELLAVEQELTRVRAEIDGLQGQKAYLERQTSMSTVTLELVGPRAVVRPQGEDWGFVAALTTAVRAFVGTINAMIIVFGAMLPLLAVALLVFLVIRAILRKRASAAAVRAEPPA